MQAAITMQMPMQMRWMVRSRYDTEEGRRLGSDSSSRELRKGPGTDGISSKGCFSSIADVDWMMRRAGATGQAAGGLKMRRDQSNKPSAPSFQPWDHTRLPASPEEATVVAMELTMR